MIKNTFMAIQSKYANSQVESLLAELLAVLEKHNTPTDLSLMVLGNCVSHLLQTKVPLKAQPDVALQFSKALKQSINNN